MFMFISFYFVWILLFFFVRVYLLAYSNLLNIPAGLIINALYIGMRFDIVICSYSLAPIILILPLLEKEFIKEIYCRKIVYYYFAITSLIIFYFTALEIFYFKEYGQRYNHLAIEYLKYPREVFNNIYEYYPIISITFILIALYLPINIIFRKIVYSSAFFRLKFAKRLFIWFCFLFILFIGCRNSFGHRPINIALSYFSRYQLLNEISLNGFFSFGYALVDKLKNEVDYKKKYASINNEESEKIVRNILSHEKNIGFDSKTGILRAVNTKGKSNKYNVVIIMEESLGAEFTGILGTEKYKKYNLTPNLDELAKHSILFTNAYSTGTRTARGIEGIVGSFPPIPGESSIKRSKSINNFFTIGKALKSQGYATHFIYGGQAMFDNMRGFFNSNDFDNIIEEKDFKNPVYKTTWGVSDEDLFEKANDIFSRQTSPFLAVLITTSNHMPFTFPENRITKVSKDIEDNERLNAIKYADFALGKFIKKAEKSKYFNNTLFVIAADHGTRIFGESVIPVKKFHIPVLIFAPEKLKITPRKIDTITSQIDIAPTILGILDIPYQSIFFGRNILNIKSNDGFALLQYDNLLGLLKENVLTVLYPDKSYKIFSKENFNDNFTDDTIEKKSILNNIQFEKICISYFQYADFVYKSGKTKIFEN